MAAEVAEVDTVFSNDDAFFGIAITPNVQKHFDHNHDGDEDYDEDYDVDYENNPHFDPPSKICGGAVFNKFRTPGKKHSKKSVGPSSSRKKKGYQKQENLPMKKNGLVNKITNRIMKRKKDSSTTDAEEDEETSYQEASYQPEIVVPSSIHLSSMSKSTSSSPWVTDDSFDNDDDAFRFEQHPNREVMGESTAQFINKQDPSKAESEPVDKIANNVADSNNTSRSRRNLHLLLDEMKDFNDLVQEKSNVLQQGIANIAIELEEEIQEEIKTSAVATPKPALQHETTDEMEKLKQERSFYRTEAETLRLEMKEIRAQLDEIKKCLPKMKDSKVEASPITNKLTIDSDSEEDDIPVPQSPYPTKSVSMRPPRSPRFLETLELPPLADSSKSTFRSELRDILSDLGRTTQVMRNAEAIVQQHHHNHPIRASSPDRVTQTDSNVSAVPRIGEAEDTVKQKKAEFYKYQQHKRQDSSSSMTSTSTANRSFSGYPINTSENSMSTIARMRMTDKTYRELRRRFRQQKSTNRSTSSESVSSHNDEVTIPTTNNEEQSIQQENVQEELVGEVRETEDLAELRQSWHELLNAPSDCTKSEISSEFY